MAVFAGKPSDGQWMIVAGGQYVLHGRRGDNAPADVSHTLVADTNTSFTLGLLGQTDLAVEPDGSFAITLDASPAGGRRKHIQIMPDARYLFIRGSCATGSRRRIGCGSHG